MKSDRQGRSLGLAHGGLLVVFFLSVASLMIAGREAVADFLTLQARSDVARWQRATNYQPSIQEIVKVRGLLRTGLQWSPENPALLESMGYLFLRQSARTDRLPEIRNPLLNEVVRNFRASLNSRPMSPYAWINIALSLHRKSDAPEQMWAAFDRALSYGARERAIQVRLVSIALARWDEAGASRQAAVQEIVRRAKGGAAAALRELILKSDVQALRLVVEEAKLR